jgi:hypothetical protein
MSKVITESIVTSRVSRISLDQFTLMRQIQQFMAIDISDTIV